MPRELTWFFRWYRRRANRTKILIALLIIATFLFFFGALTPSGGTRAGPTPTPAAILDGPVLYTGSG